MSKVLERVILRQLVVHLTSNGLLPEFQSAYRKGHSTETAVLKVFSVIVDDMDKGKFVLLSLLDLSAAFDTVDHDILLHKMSTSFGVGGDVLIWFKSYLIGRSQSVYLPTGSSVKSAVTCVVPQGSILGPILLTLYTADICRLISTFELKHHCYADDQQIHGSCSLTDCGNLKLKMLDCIQSVEQWMPSNRLRLNPAKLEFMWCCTSRRLYLADTLRFNLPDGDVEPSGTVRDLGAFFDQAVTMKDHVNRLVNTCNFQLRCIRSIRRSLPMITAIQLVNSFVI